MPVMGKSQIATGICPSLGYSTADMTGYISRNIEQKQHRIQDAM